MQDQWLSLHVFLADPRRQERYLCERLAPQLRAWREGGMLDQWFYVRYWEGGPHLRIRLRGPVATDPQAAAAALGRQLDGYLSASPPQRDSYYAAHAFDGEPVDVAALPWYPEGSVEPIAYVPEYARYGGEAALAASERLFMLSSRIALDLCAATAGNMAARMAAAGPLMAATLLAAGESIAETGAYCRRYAALWSRFSPASGDVASRLETQPVGTPAALAGMLPQLARQLGAAANPRNPNVAWAGGVAELVQALRREAVAGTLLAADGNTLSGDGAAIGQRILEILGSQIHMLNNRLGIVPAGEVLLAAMVARAAACEAKELEPT